MMSYLTKNKKFEEYNINIFREEIKDLSVKSPTIIAFGKDSHSILKRNFKNGYKIFEIPHYSYTKYNN